MITKRIVLIGCQGMGKTTFFNLITDSNEQTQYQRMSCTRQLVQGTTRWGQGLDVIDTPGFNVSEDKLMHVAGILAGLTYGKINRILIFIKYERDYYMYQNLEAAFNPVRRYRNLITIVVTYWDQCQINKEQQQARLSNEISEKYLISSIIFKSKSDNPEFICNQIEQQIKENQQNNENDGISIKLSESEIFKHFDFLDMNGQLQNQIEYDKGQVLTKFRRIAQIYEKFIKGLDNNDADFLETLHVITLSIKEQANKVIDNFEMNNRDRILQLVDNQGNDLQYLHYISLKKSLFMDMNNIINFAQVRMKESKYHVFHCIKKCQNCGLIWLKVTGCGKKTKCGDQASSNFDGLFMTLPQTKVQIFYDEENNTITKRSLEEQIKKQEKPFKYLLNFLMKQNEILKCQISKEEIESILQELYGPKFKEEVIRCINNGFQEIELIDSIILNYCFSKDKENLYDEIYEELERKKKQKKQGVGCGQLINWQEQIPLTSDELKELLTVEMLEYFTFQENTKQEEIKWLSQAYKNIIEETINNQIKNIKRLNRNN